MPDSSTPSPFSPTTASPAVRTFEETPEGYRWDTVEQLVYKPTGTHFHDITRQVLFSGDEAARAQLRYFEMAPEGYSTFERHAHVHAVLILRGSGHVLVGEKVSAIRAFDLVRVPPMTWHQFRADAGEALGFLCLVACDRDRPQRPSPEQIETLKAHPQIGSFMRL